MKRNNLIYAWVKNGAWIDKNWKKLQKLCFNEEFDAGIERPWVKATLKEVEDEQVMFQIKSNSQYVFQYMMEENFRMKIKEKSNK